MRETRWMVKDTGKKRRSASFAVVVNNSLFKMACAVLYAKRGTKRAAIIVFSVESRNVVGITMKKPTLTL